MEASMMLWVGAALVFVAMSVALFSLTVGMAERRDVSRSVDSVRAMDAGSVAFVEAGAPSFSDRVLHPLSERMAEVGRYLAPTGVEQRVRHRLDVAGNPPGWSVDRVLAAKAASLVGGCLLGLAWTLSSGSVLKLLVAAAILGGGGFLLPDLILREAGTRRERAIRSTLPDALDVLTICVESGLAFDAALLQVARKTRGPLSLELSRLLQEMQIGSSRSEAMRAMSERSTLVEIRAFCSAMIQADQLGVPVARVLRTQSKEMRVRRRQRAEESAQKVQVKMMVPLVLLILPCLFLVVGGAAAISIVRAFG